MHIKENYGYLEYNTSIKLVSVYYCCSLKLCISQNIYVTLFMYYYIKVYNNMSMFIQFPKILKKNHIYPFLVFAIAFFQNLGFELKLLF